MDTIKTGSVANLSYMINSISNLKNHINNASYYVDNLSSIKRRISDSTTLVIKPREIETIDKVALLLFSEDLAKRVFRRHKTLSERLKRLWNIFQEICDNDPDLVVYCVTNLIEKKLPKKTHFRGDGRMQECSIVKLSPIMQECQYSNQLHL